MFPLAIIDSCFLSITENPSKHYLINFFSLLYFIDFSNLKLKGAGSFLKFYMSLLFLYQKFSYFWPRILSQSLCQELHLILDPNLDKSKPIWNHHWAVSEKNAKIMPRATHHALNWLHFFQMIESHPLVDWLSALKYCLSWMSCWTWDYFSPT